MGRLAVLLPGLGAVATTMIAGVMLARTKIAQPIGSLAGLCGIQEWVGFYFKSPMHREGVAPEHDLFRQERALHSAIRRLAGIDVA